ncbi:MAG: transporter [Nitrospirota bacterium]
MKLNTFSRIETWNDRVARRTRNCFNSIQIAIGGKGMLKKGLLIAALLLIMSNVATAKDILITNDTGTQGKGHLLVEVNSEFSFDEESADGVTTKESGIEFESIFSYGLAENIDFIVALPYAWNKVKEDGVTIQKEEGISDVGLELKWRFYEKDGLSFALKPGISLPTGDDEKGLGAGRAAYGIFFITTKEVQPLLFHLNLAYTRNENKVDERKDIWYASLSGEVELIKKLTFIGNVGVQTNTDPASGSPPAFILGGFNYEVTDAFSVNAGIKGGLTRAETDYAVLTGLAWRF